MNILMYCEDIAGCCYSQSIVAWFMLIADQIGQFLKVKGHGKVSRAATLI